MFLFSRQKLEHKKSFGVSDTLEESHLELGM